LSRVVPLLSLSLLLGVPAAAGTISELPHPPLVVQLHPSADQPFTLEDIDRALREGANAIELDLRFRPGDQTVVCGHSRRGLSDHPTLAQSIRRVLWFMGDSPSVQRDGLQFFLVLDFKERSAALYDGVITELRQHATHWSTSAGPNGPPRGITVVASGDRAGLRALVDAETLDSLCILEGVDYAGRIRNRSPLPGRGFQWIAIQHPGERGRVRALHTGMDLSARGVYNVRAYDCHEALRDCVAHGVDAVNADADRDEIARARSLGEERERERVESRHR